MLVVSVIGILRTIEMNWTGIDRDTRPSFIFAADESSAGVRWICNKHKVALILWQLRWSNMSRHGFSYDATLVIGNHIVKIAWKLTEYFEYNR